MSRGAVWRQPLPGEDQRAMNFRDWTTYFSAQLLTLDCSSGERVRTTLAGEPMDGIGAEKAMAMMMQIQIRHLPALYLELIMLGLPTLVGANGLIDKAKKG